MADAVEGAHMDHPDFRVKTRIFATLHAENKVGMVKLTPEQQKRFVQEAPAAFAPESGAWGRSACTSVRLDAVDGDTLGEAMRLAWQNVACFKLTLEVEDDNRRARALHDRCGFGDAVVGSARPTRFLCKLLPVRATTWRE
jgi:hypothetical protein